MKLVSTLLADTPFTLDNMTAADLMTSNPHSIREDATVTEAIHFMTRNGLSGAVVINAAGRPVGVLTNTDIMIHSRERTHGKEMPLIPMAEADYENWVAEGSVVGPTFVSEVMTPIVFTVRDTDAARKVIEQMVSLHVHRIFVVDDADVVVGVISALDVLKRLV